MISLSDPCSAWTAKANKRVQFGYGLNHLIDIENAVIVDVEATPARTYDEVAAARIRAASIACTVAVRLAETLFALGDVAPAWTIRDGARMAAVRAHHSFR